MNDKNRRKKFYANKLHKDIFTLVFFAALIPAVIVAACLYYLIFYITAEQIAIPEAIAYNLIPAAKKVIMLVLFAAPVSILTMLMLAHKISHRIIGPFDRIMNELDEYTKGKKEDHIVVRKGDRFKPLVDKINKLLDKIR